MSIQVSLADNTAHKLPIEFAYLSNVFKSGEVTHIHTNAKVFAKLKDFGTYYLNFDDKEKKQFDNIEQLFEKEPDINSWCMDFLNMEPEILTELTTISFDLNIKVLLNLCCYNIAEIINNKSIPDIREYFKIENDFTPEEDALLEEETEWIEE